MAGDPGPLGLYSDASRRATDAMLLHVLADPHNGGRWMAIRLADGETDGTTYATKGEAYRYQDDPTRCCYARIHNTVTYREMSTFLNYNRQLYDEGFRMPDPDE